MSLLMLTFISLCLHGYDLGSQIDIQNTLVVKLTNVNELDYEYTLRRFTNTQFEINFHIQNTIPQTMLQLELPCPSQPGRQYGNIKQQFITKKIPFISQEGQHREEGPAMNQ